MHDIRQRRGEAEGVGEVEDVLGRAAFAEEALEFALAEQGLADERLGRRDVDIGFDPHRADRFPSALGDALLDAVEQGGCVLLEVGVLLGLRADEGDARVVVHDLERVGPGADDLAAGLADGPEPGGVDVGVGDGEAEVGARRARGV